MSRQEQLFQLWLDNELTAAQQHELDQLVANDEALQSRLNTARLIEQQVYCHEQETVPKWDPGSVFESNKKPWWQWSGLPLTSLSCSLFAIMLVVFNVEFSMHNDGLMVRFGQSHTLQQNDTQTDQHVMRQIEQRLQLFAAEQELTIANLKNDFKESQQASNLELVTYLMASTRKERQQDISNFIQYVNEQRNDDVIEQKIRFQTLQLQLNKQQLSSTVKPIASHNK